jgi:thiamine biosynthesis lipoprotein
VTDLQRELEDSIEKIEQFASEPVVTFCRAAMACLFEIQFPVTITDRKTPAVAFDLIDDLEEQLSVYRAESEVSMLNARAHQDPVPVEPRLFELLKRCASWSEATEGAFDVTAGPLVRAWGFLRREGRLPTAEEIAAARGKVGMHHVTLQSVDRTVQFDQPGLEINFGSVGKGYTLDRVAELLAEASFAPALLSAGHSSMRAIGSPPWDTAWQVDIAHPTNENEKLAEIRLADRSLSTSGIASQWFEHNGKRYGHILDPRSGWPATGMLQTTVVAPDAALAEVLSTAFFIHGQKWAANWCARHPEIGALLVSDPPPGQQPYITRLGSIDVRVVPPR